MTEAKTNSKSKSNVLSLVYMAMFVAIITVCAQIQIPMTVPFTLQTLGIFMAAAMLGWKRGLISVAVYVLLGAIGVPVFAGFQAESVFSAVRQAVISSVSSLRHLSLDL